MKATTWVVMRTMNSLHRGPPKMTPSAILKPPLLWMLTPNITSPGRVVPLLVPVHPPSITLYQLFRPVHPYETTDPH